MNKNELLDLLLRDIAFRDFITDLYIMSSLDNDEGLEAISGMYGLYKSGIDTKTVVKLLISSKKYL